MQQQGDGPSKPSRQMEGSLGESRRFEQAMAQLETDVRNGFIMEKAPFVLVLRHLYDV
jgi:hypothetical protein